MRRKSLLLRLLEPMLHRQHCQLSNGPWILETETRDARGLSPVRVASIRLKTPFRGTCLLYPVDTKFALPILTPPMVFSDFEGNIPDKYTNHCFSDLDDINLDDFRSVALKKLSASKYLSRCGYVLAWKKRVMVATKYCWLPITRDAILHAHCEV